MTSPHRARLRPIPYQRIHRDRSKGESTREHEARERKPSHIHLSGGIGSAVIQLARHGGVTVIGTASVPKHDYLRALGATPTTYGRGLVERVRKLAPTSVTGALDLAGRGVIPELIEVTGDPSRVVSIVDFTAPHYGAQGSFEVQKHPERALADAGRLYSEGAFRVALEKTFPLAQAAEAYTLGAAGHVTGKLVITVS